MPYENITSGEFPTSLNTDWPLDEDPIIQGQYHIRSVKSTIAKGWSAYNSFIDNTDELFENNQPKVVVNALTLNNQTKEYLLDAANVTGRLDSTQLPAAGFIQPGAVQLSSEVSDSQTMAATPKALKEIKDGLVDGEVVSDLIQWTDIPITHVDKQYVTLPSDLLAAFSTGAPIELAFMMFNEDSYISHIITLYNHTPGTGQLVRDRFEDLRRAAYQYNLQPNVVFPRWQVVIGDSTVSGLTKRLTLTPSEEDLTLVQARWRRTQI